MSIREHTGEIPFDGPTSGDSRGGSAAERPHPLRSLSELHLSADLFRLLVECVQDFAIFLLDLDGHVASWNEGARRITGYRSDEIIGKHFSCFFTRDDIARGQPEKELAIAKAMGRCAKEGQRLRKDGSDFWASVVTTALYDDAHKLRGFAKVTRDITFSKAAEEKSRLMVSLALNAMVLVDERGIITLVNPQTETLFGYASHELIGQSIEMLVPDRFKADHPANRTRYFRNPVVRPMGAGRDLYGRRSDGSEFPVEIGLHPLDTDGGRQVLGSIVDITERKRAEEQSRKYLAELAHVARLSTTGQMVSELAHEMNQPLAAAANYARACVAFARSGKGATVEQLAEWMEKTAAQVARTLDIVNRIAGFVKYEPATRAIINVNRLIENIVSLSIPTMLSGAGTTVCKNGETKDTCIRAILALDESLPPVKADRIQIEQVLLNLVRNAIEAMQGIPPADARLSLSTSKVGEFVRVDVSDNGKGIAPDELGRLFGPFFTTKPSGMGLGLSISRSIIENHNGAITVESTPGRGTTFRFSLPVAREREES